jgi:predicted RNA binding protein YcfA (HicA-like mRNA interferase family)
MKPSKLLSRILSGCVTNVAFSDLVALLLSLDFQEVGGKGSHRVFAKPGIVELLTLQEADGQAKPYQVRQVIALIRRYNMSLEEEP